MFSVGDHRAVYFFVYFTDEGNLIFYIDLYGNFYLDLFHLHLSHLTRNHNVLLYTPCTNLLRYNTCTYRYAYSFMQSSPIAVGTNASDYTNVGVTNRLPVSKEIVRETRQKRNRRQIRDGVRECASRTHLYVRMCVLRAVKLMGRTRRS